MSQTSNTKNRFFRYLWVGMLCLFTLWFLQKQSAEFSFSSIKTSLQTANWGYALVAVLSILVTNLVKAYRWIHLFPPSEKRPTLQNGFNALMNNQFINQVSPIRVGEIARAHYVWQKQNISRAASMGTIIIEKSLELLFLGITAVILLITIPLPNEVAEKTTTYGLISLTLLVGLIFLAYKGNLLLKIAQRVATWMPALLGRKFLKITQSGLASLTTVQEKRQLIFQLFLSTIVTLCYISTPYLLLKAFNIPMGFMEAAAINAFVNMIAGVIPIPGKIGIFETATIFLLTSLNPVYAEANGATLLSYAILFHLVTLVPPLVLGAITTIGSNFDWRSASPSAE